MVHYAPKKTCNNTSIINHLGINIITERGKENGISFIEHLLGANKFVLFDQFIKKKVAIAYYFKML